MSTPPLPTSVASVQITGDTVTVGHLELTDPVVAGYLASLDPGDRIGEVLAALSVGVRGLAAMGTGATAHRVGEVVEQLVDGAFARTERHVSALLEAGRREMGNTLDPEIRSSITARTMTELAALHRELLDGIDPGRRDSKTARFVAELEGLLGPGGQLECRLNDALDPATDGSAVGTLMRTLELRFQELRDLIVGSDARAEEAQRGTAKGFAFEDIVEARLRGEARHLGGALVERVSMEAGANGSQAIVGDLVVTLPDGTRIVVEAKHSARIGLTGRDGILDELDRAMANRTATWGVCVSHDDAFPAEVGSFGIYGNRVLVVDDGSGDLIQVALRWIAAIVRQAAARGAEVDTGELTAQLERMRGLATRFSRAKRGLGQIQSSVEAVRCEMDELRAELLDGVDEMTGTLVRTTELDTAPRVA